jgi:hypothetical protein
MFSVFADPRWLVVIWGREGLMTWWRRQGRCHHQLYHAVIRYSLASVIVVDLVVVLLVIPEEKMINKTTTKRMKLPAMVPRSPVAFVVEDDPGWSLSWLVLGEERFDDKDDKEMGKSANSSKPSPYFFALVVIGDSGCCSLGRKGSDHDNEDE